MNKTRYEQVKMDTMIPMKILHINSQDHKTVTLNTRHFIPPHWHRSLELSLVVKGALQLRCASETQIIQAGEILLVNSGDIHEINNVPGDAVEVICFLISYDYLQDRNPNFDTVRFELTQHAIIAELIKKILNQHQSEDSLAYIKIRSDLDLIMYYLFRDAVAKCNLKKVQYSQESLKQVLSYIHEHYQENIRLEGIAKEFFMSREHFARRFKENFGKTFLDYLMDVRIHHAFVDVVQSNLSVEVMSRKYGFPSAKAMIHQFKKRYELPPITYRNTFNTTVIDPFNPELTKNFPRYITN